MTKFVLTIITLTILLSNVVSASNPADLTTDHRSFICEFYKLCYDGGPRYAYVNLPISETVNTSVFNWQNKKGDYRSSQLIIAKKFASWFDGAIDTIHTENSLSENVVAVIHWDMLGLGIKLPLQSDEDISVGPRITAKGLTAYLTATISESASNLYGLTYCIKDIKAEVAYGSETWYFRVSKGFKTHFGTFFPESRNKFTKDEKFFGLALGFVPN